MSRIVVVVGAQYGSEGKGAVAAHLSTGLRWQDVAIRVAGPNAGHTAYDAEGRQHKLRQVPVAAVVNRKCKLLIAAGSEVDPPVLLSEISTLDSLGYRVSDRLIIDPSATRIERRHKNVEADAGLVRRIGSTGKGIGAARADRLMRGASTMVGQFPHLGVERWRPTTDSDAVYLVEGTQGYGLGLHTDNYPHTTSSDCRAIDFLAMAGLSPWAVGVERVDVWVVARAYPIRVAGPSGRLHGETTWQALGLPEERTTVTNKVRRVGEFNLHQVELALEANGGARSPNVWLALTMLDHRFPEIEGATTLDHPGMDKAMDWVYALEERTGARVALVGTSPTTMVEVRPC